MLNIKTNDFLNKNSKQDIKDFNCLKNLSKKNINVCKFDKGNGLVILDHDEYIKKLNNVLEAPQFSEIIKFRKNGKLPPIKDEQYVISLLNDLVKNNHMKKSVADSIRPIGSQPAKLYGLPKVHKEGMPLRPVLSMIETAQYKIAKYLDSILKPLIKSELECKDSFEFASFISKLHPNSNDDYMVSFDVVSLFTNVPLSETIDLCCSIWNDNSSKHANLDVVAFRKLLSFATSNVHFMFNNNWYKQVDGVAMGSPLAPTMASVFLSSLESKYSLFTHEKPLVYKRYVDDVFLIFKHRDHVQNFLNFVNSLHGNIKFTCEEEKTSSIPFLDLLIKRYNNESYNTEIYRKTTDTGLYTSPNSFCDFKYKRNMIKGLIYRSWTLPSTYDNSVKSVNKLLTILQNNGYSKSLLESMAFETIDKCIRKERLNKLVDSKFLVDPSIPLDSGKMDNIENSASVINEEASTDSSHIVDVDNTSNSGVIGSSDYFVLTLPYSEGFRDFKKSIVKLSDKVRIKIVSKSCKVTSIFCNKSVTPFDLCSNLVYSFKCNGCNATYIGETARHLCTRVQEHCRLSGKSNIADHNKICKQSIGISNFKIISKSFKNYWERVTVEALQIKLLKPKINVQNALSTCILRVFA